MNAQQRKQQEPTLALPELELRVLAGPQAGARSGLPDGGSLLIAAGPAGQQPAEADLLLLASEPLMLRLRAEGPLCRCELLLGQAQLGEQALAAGSAFDWPAHMALQLGAALVLAFGEREAAIWALRPAPEAWNQAGEAAEQDSVDIDAHGAAASTADRPAGQLTVPPVGAGRRPRGELWLAGGGALLALAGLALVLLQEHLPAPALPAQDPMLPLQALLASQPDFAALRLEREASGQPRLSGRVAGQSQQAQLQQRLLALGLRPAQQIQVDSQLAAAVEELLQMQGLEVKANVFGLGEVRLEPHEPSQGQAQGQGPAPSLAAPAVEQALAQVRAALPQLRSLQLAGPAPAAAASEAVASAAGQTPTLPSAGGEPGKRIVALVSHGLPHLITADGARYFVGALLPSGHRVAAVLPQALLLERDGRQSRIDF